MNEIVINKETTDLYKNTIQSGPIGNSTKIQTKENQECNSSIHLCSNSDEVA